MATKEEVEIPTEDYEIVPLTPLRNIERRLEEIESSKGFGNLDKFVDKIIDMVELNQKIVDEVVKSNQGLREDLAVLIGKLDDLQSKLVDFIDIIKSAGEEEGKESISKDIIEKTVTPVVEKVAEISKKTSESNVAIVDALDSIDKRLKRMQLGGKIKPSATNILARRRIERGTEGEF